ncbi:MAG: hypothetical protein IMY79_01760 [Chloroflexi bacterium]|nr:hypothetical protein [Chloroflexota bacterium]
MQSRGYRVANIKHAPRDAGLDEPGQDGRHQRWHWIPRHIDGCKCQG